MQASIPCQIPEEARELFRYSRGLEGANLLNAAHRVFTRIDLAGLQGGFGLEEIFPHAVSIAGDGCGNFWVIDLPSDSNSWGPVFYACHDAPVIVYQADGLAHFIEEALRGGHPPWEGRIEELHRDYRCRI